MLNIPIAVQDALRDGTMRKNYKMKVNDVDPDSGERTYSYTIENDELVSESVKIDERMVTGKNLKFGLCEGSVLEFQYFNHPNINGKDVQVYLSAEYVDTDDVVKWYDIPMGWYSVDQCPMQWDTGIFKVTAYNKLKSKYLDAKANSLIEDMQSDSSNPDEITIQTIQSVLLEDYSITPMENPVEAISSGGGGQHLYGAGPTFKFNGSNTTYYPIIQMDYVSFVDIDSNKMTKIEISGYLEKLKTVAENFKAAVFDSVQNPDTFWNALLNSIVYQEYFGCLAALGPYADYNASYLIFEDEITTWDKSIHGYIEKLKYLYTANRLEFMLPVSFKGSQSSSSYTNVRTLWETDLSIETGDVYVGSMDVDSIDTIFIPKTNLEEVTLRDIVSANYELHCQYGRLDRETDLFGGVELNQGGLYPADTLYPDNTLYPSGPSLHPFPSTYQKLWTDTVGEQSFRYLIITYKAIENGEEVDKTLQRTVNTYGTTNYNMSDNWLFRNLVWTAEDVGAYADAMVLKMKDVRWFPFELWCAGLPYIETGDAIEITDRQGDTHTSYVLTRTLEGIHNLQDTFINGELDVF